MNYIVILNCFFTSYDGDLVKKTFNTKEEAEEYIKDMERISNFSMVSDLEFHIRKNYSKIESEFPYFGHDFKYLYHNELDSDKDLTMDLVDFFPELGQIEDSKEISLRDISLILFAEGKELKSPLL